MKLASREFGQGKPLLILHGLFGQSDNWNTLSKQFAELGFHVFAIDQRNHGHSPHSTEWSYDVMAADLDEFIRDHQLQDPILMGHSMGAKTVLYFEYLYPGIASALILVDMAARVYPAHHEGVLTALKAVDLSVVSSRKEAEQILNAGISDLGTRQFLLKNLYWKDEHNKKLDWRFNLDVINNNYHHIVKEVPPYHSDVKTLVVKGEKSNYITADDLVSFRERFPNLSFASITNAGHWVHAEQPKTFYDVVSAFIKDPVG